MLPVMFNVNKWDRVYLSEYRLYIEIKKLAQLIAWFAKYKFKINHNFYFFAIIKIYSLYNNWSEIKYFLISMNYSMSKAM